MLLEIVSAYLPSAIDTSILKLTNCQQTSPQISCEVIYYFIFNVMVFDLEIQSITSIRSIEDNSRYQF